jgi:hypothetical protein
MRCDGFDRRVLCRRHVARRARCRAAASGGTAPSPGVDRRHGRSSPLPTVALDAGSTTMKLPVVHDRRS